MKGNLGQRRTYSIEVLFRATYYIIILVVYSENIYSIRRVRLLDDVKLTAPLFR